MFALIPSPPRQSTLRGLLLTVLAGSLALGACTGDTPTAPRAASGDAPMASLASTICFPTRAGKPDLVATIESVGPMQIETSTTRLAPVTGVVTNIGTACASTFRVGGHQFVNAGVGEDGGWVEGYTGAGLTVTETAAISARGFTKAPLNAGASVRFSGMIRVQVASPSEAALVRLVADACNYVDEEGLPTYCRVSESNEANNSSDWRRIALP